MATLFEQITQSRGMRNRAIFRAIMPGILDAIERGLTNRDIWDALVQDGRLHCSYETFCWYVRKAVKPKKSLTPERRITNDETQYLSGSPPPDPKDLLTKKRENAVIKEFVFERVAKEDLI